MGDLNKWPESKDPSFITKKNVLDSTRQEIIKLLSVCGGDFDLLRIGDFDEFRDNLWKNCGESLSACGYTKDDPNNDLMYDCLMSTLDDQTSQILTSYHGAFDSYSARTGKDTIEMSDLRDMMSRPVPEKRVSDDRQTNAEKNGPGVQNPSGDGRDLSAAVRKKTTDAERQAAAEEEAVLEQQTKNKNEQSADDGRKPKSAKHENDSAETDDQLTALRKSGGLSDSQYQAGMAISTIMAMSARNMPVMRTLLDPANYLSTSQRATLRGKRIAKELKKELDRFEKLNARAGSIYNDILQMGNANAAAITNGKTVPYPDKSAGQKKTDENTRDAGGRTERKSGLFSGIADKIKNSGKKPETDGRTEVSEDESQAVKAGKLIVSGVKKGAIAVGGFVTAATGILWAKAEDLRDTIRRSPSYQTFCQFPAVMWLKDTGRKINDEIKAVRDAHRKAGDHDHTPESAALEAASVINVQDERELMRGGFLDFMKAVGKTVGACTRKAVDKVADMAGYVRKDSLERPAKPEDQEQAVKSEDQEQAVKSEDQEQAAKPEDQEQAAKPEDQEQFAKPETGKKQEQIPEGYYRDEYGNVVPVDNNMDYDDAPPDGEFDYPDGSDGSGEEPSADVADDKDKTPHTPTEAMAATGGEGVVQTKSEALAKLRNALGDNDSNNGRADAETPADDQEEDQLG